MSTVLYVMDGHVATLTFNRPEAMNAINAELLTDLSAAINKVRNDQPRAVLLTGAGGKAFVAGADVSEMANMAPNEAQRFSEHGNVVFRALESLPMPTIAVVGGYALGGGCELALCCDIRLASTNARFGQPEVSLGITPGFGATQRLPRLVGFGIAKEMIFSGRTIDATRALAIGLVNAIFEPEQLMAAAKELAQAIAAMAPVAVSQSKMAIDSGAQTGIDQGLAIEAAHFAACFNTNDQKEGMSAFLEKRNHGLFQGN